MSRVLIVEDEADNREVLRIVVEEMARADAIVAVNGKEAITLLEHDDLPDAILMDIMMTPPDGLETVRRLRANPRTRHIPVIAITALARASDVQRGMDAGCTDYVTKPFDIEFLCERIEHALGRESLASGSRE